MFVFRLILAMMVVVMILTLVRMYLGSRRR
jgi:hypothetical protein